MIDVYVKRATIDDALIVGALVCQLLCELLPEKYSGQTPESFAKPAQQLIGSESVYALLAKIKNNNAIGLVTLNSCASIYARGAFGTIGELYVDPEYRSDGVGTKLIDAAKEFSLGLGWNHLEVGAPSLPRWQRTLDFYTYSGFSIIGPRLSIGLPK